MPDGPPGDGGTRPDSPGPAGGAREAGLETSGPGGAGSADEEPLVSPDEVRDAAARVHGAVLRTPLVRGDLPDDGGTVWLKCESLQHGGAFKMRGAYNFVALLSGEERARGLITYSSGNHAQGVARAARAFGVGAVIVMPEDAPAVKVRNTRRLGGEVVLEGRTTTERRTRALELARESGAAVVPPFDHRHVIAGQGTAALEACEQLRAAADDGRASSAEPAVVVVPIGGGGLISGHATALREAAPSCRVVGVEPEGAASMKRSLEAGEPVSLERIDTIADGLKPVRPGDLTFRHVRELVDRVVTVTDAALVRALRWCFDRGLVVEPSGGATVAALLEGAVPRPSGGEVVAVLSGRNADTGAYGEWIADGDRVT